VRGRASLLVVLVGGLAGCQGVPSAAPPEAGLLDAAAPAISAQLIWSRPFGEEGEAPAAMVAAGPDRLLVLTDQSVYQLTLEGRVVSRSPLPAPVRGAGGVSGLAWDGSGLGLALRWRGDASIKAGTYLALADETGAFSPSSMLPVAGPEVALRSAFDGAAQVVVWAAAAGDGLELDELRATRGGAPIVRRLASGLEAGLSLGDLLAGPAGVSLCSLEGDGRVLLRGFDAGGQRLASVGSPDRQGIGPCRLASSGRSTLLAWRNRALPPGPGDAGTARDLGLKALGFDQPVARLVPPGGEPAGAGPLPLTAQTGTLRIEAALWDGARYLVLIDAAGVRGGRLFLTLLDEAGGLLERDLPLPIEVEPAVLQTSALVAGTPDYYLLYGLRRPWDEGILYLARFSLGAAPVDAR
jgi:hypothetical protein